MPQAILKTKLFIPPARAQAVERLRLLERIDHLLSEACRVGVFSAPAGFGKTTLIVQWLARGGTPAGWLSLDERDNLPARFFAYLVAALRQVVPGAGREVESLLELPGAGVDEIVTLLVNDLVEAPELFILVLDDFHVITNPLLHQAVDLLIEAQPPQMRLVLLSREDPGIQLARRRTRNQLAEFRQADLAFTLEEAAAFVRESMGLQLTNDQVQALETRTEGWIAGLQMAAIAIQSPLDLQADAGEGSGIILSSARLERFLQDFSGSHHFILDYLMEEVLAQQPEAVQAFLLETSILERMQVELCAAVTGKTIALAHRLLEQVSRANLFIIPLDSERRWYRYHHLFGDLLLARLQAERPADIANLFLRASDWFEANGDPRLAVEYALKAGDYRQAADFIERHITERWQTVDIEFFRLVDRLPFEVVAKRPSLCLHNAWLCVMFGQNERILPFVEAAERAIEQAGKGDASTAANLAFARTLRAYVTDLRNQPVMLDESLERAYAAISEANPGMRNSVAVVIGMICFMEGDFSSALRYYEAALALDKRVNGTNAVPIATMRICFVLQAQGRLHEAMRRLREAEDYVSERGIRRYYISGSLFQRMAEILLEWNWLDESEDRLQKGTRLLEDWPMPTTKGLGLALLARLRVAQSDLAGASAALAQAEANARQTGLHPFFLDALERARVGLYLAEQNRPALEAWARENAAYSKQPLSFRYEARQIELCRVWLALGRAGEAVELLDRLAEAAREHHGSRIRILALLACAHGSNPDTALPPLEEALRLAEPEGYLRTFLKAGEPLHQLLRLWLQRGPSREDARLKAYALAILSAFGHPVSIATVKQTTGLSEPLSPREQEVLVLLAQGLANQQIADRLVISIRTVKKHVENINGKLGAANRTSAVIRAQELRLLP